MELDTWYGFIITSSPHILDMLMVDEPGFGYGPLSDGLECYQIAIRLDTGMRPKIMSLAESFLYICFWSMESEYI